MLMHHADAQSDRVMRIFDLDRFSVDQYLAAVRSLEPVNDLHRRRFSGAVLANDRMYRRFFDLQRNVLVRDRFAKCFAYVFKFKHRLN